MAENDETKKPVRRGGWFNTGSMGLLVFGFGVAAGFLIAFSGLGIVEDAAGILLLVFLTALMFISAFGLAVYLFRKPLLRRLFGFAQTELESFAEPLAEVARGAVDRNPQKATDAARDLVHMAFARYAWVSTRRWIIGSLTALIAAMAALAGTALLFRQNQLLQDQSVLFAEQNTRIDQQITLDQYTVQLAEASRNAQLVVEITAIAGELGQAVDRVMAAQGVPETGSGARSVDGSVPVLDPLQDLDLGLIMRISSASLATRPYRFLKGGITTHDQGDILRDALARRREDLPQTWAAMSQGFGWEEETGGLGLVDRPASPERGQLLTALLQSGIRNTEVLSFYGLDLSYAYAQGLILPTVSAQSARLAYADLSYAQVFETDFGGAALTGARFQKAFMRDVSFASVPGEAINPPYSKELAVYHTNLAGTDFTGAYLLRPDFRNVNALAVQFDGATLVEAQFQTARVSAGTFRGAVLLDADFSGADVGSVDFDGAIMIGADALEQLAATVAPGSFVPDRFEADAISLEEAMEVASLYSVMDFAELEARVGTRGLVRIKRVQPFEN
ncbi:pentapeptide repeat-containing protein [Shimia abyssi]|uniref:Pentapeptide repeat protein n=1 Tax=Shimia abyssi TaxID=1662395 RepID=A0A2P8FGW9_9RHOB|nr:pentapeptide repeat-containing protein [Shimia abyssi]PSL20966.1 pentapeptide repeat protein [Shimia abyssi]